MAEVGGAIAAVARRRRPAVAWLTRLTAVASGGRAPEPGHPARRLRRRVVGRRRGEGRYTVVPPGHRGRGLARRAAHRRRRQHRDRPRRVRGRRAAAHLAAVDAARAHLRRARARSSPGSSSTATSTCASDVTGLCIASVVPDVTSSLREMAAAYLALRARDRRARARRPACPVLTDNPREVGADRVVNTLAAFTRFGGPAIVVDFGTGTNFDVVSRRRRVPRRRDRARAADQRGRPVRADGAAHARGPAAAALAGRQEHRRGDPVRPALRHGGRGRRRSSPGSAASSERPTPPTVATGGLAPVVIPHCTTVDHHEPWLTLEGLRLVYERNADG